MTNLKYAMLLLVAGPWLLLILDVKGQEFANQGRLEITYNKTSSLIFPTVITSVDRGSQDILAQKAKGVDNVLQLKAARLNFPETNITVITADGAIREYTISYSKQPTQLVYQAHVTTISDHPSVVFNSAMTKTQMTRYAGQIVRDGPGLKLKNSRKFGIQLSLRGIFVKDDIIFYRFRINNTSNLNYDVELIRFFIQDQAKAKRTASQEIDIVPLFAFGNDKQIMANSTSEIVYGLQKFTIPDAKRLNIEMFEKNGGRNLNLSVRNRSIVNAQLLP